MLVWKFMKEKELLSLSVNLTGNYASVALLSSSNKHMIHSLGLDPSETLQRQLIDLHMPSTLDKKANDCPIQWGIHTDTEELLAVGANRKLELWNFARSVPQPFSLTQGHLLAIRDINWSRDPNLLGSCSYDSSVLIWDTRNNTQPSVRIKTLGGASCIKFSRKRENIVALSHEDIITIWDIRSCNTSLAFLDLPKVLNFDWHPTIPHMLSTASKDGFIRIWNYEHINPYPLAEKSNRQNGVSKVKFTPCGKGIVTCSTVITHSSPSITLWGLRESSSGNWDIVNAGSVGNEKEQVLGMEWAQGYDRYKLCTISTAKEMRLYEVDPQSFSSMETPEGRALGKGREPMSSEQLKSIEHYEPTSLPEEVDLIKKYLSQNEKVDFKQITSRHYSVKMFSSDNKNEVECKIFLPLHYPRACEPNFEIYTSLGLIEDSVKSELVQTLTSTAAHYVSHNKFCLRYCIDTLASSFHKLSLENSVHQDLNVLYSHNNKSAPRMRTSFGANDKLVFLSRPPVRAARALTDVTPRINTLTQSFSHPAQSSHSTRASKDVCSVVKVCDLSHLTQLSYEMAEDEQLFGTSEASLVCYQNRMLAATHNRYDLVQVWHLLLEIVSVKSECYSRYIQFMSGELVTRALEYYLKIRDVQAVASISSFVTGHNMAVEKKARIKIRDVELRERAEFYKKIYSQVLTRWGLLNSECKLLKCMQQNNPVVHELFSGDKMKCVICHYLVKGLSSICSVCRHGGHPHHVRDWFSANGECPAGCGCMCLQMET